MENSINIHDIDNLVQKFISDLHNQFNASEETLLTLWQEVQTSTLQSDFSRTISSKTKSSKHEQKPEKEPATCQAILKRKSQPCGKKVSKNSKTGKYCSVHCKCENSTTANTPDLSNYHIFKKNAFENFTYGDTGLILKNKDEQKIIGHQSANGTIRDLTADEITLCQRRRLDYIANYHANLAEKCKASKMDTIEHTSKLSFL
jgi:hypothetical protein